MDLMTDALYVSALIRQAKQPEGEAAADRDLGFFEIRESSPRPSGGPIDATKFPRVLGSTVGTCRCGGGSKGNKTEQDARQVSLILRLEASNI